ncbi:hypothetical protein LINPERPRIM_LOCUS18855 [Linum perenne]
MPILSKHHCPPAGCKSQELFDS